jgi:hypothetical protein
VGVSYSQFETDFRINFTVVRALEIIGEAAKRLPDDLRRRYPDIPWKGILKIEGLYFRSTSTHICSPSVVSSIHPFLSVRSRLYPSSASSTSGSGPPLPAAALNSTTCGRSFSIHSGGLSGAYPPSPLHALFGGLR